MEKNKKILLSLVLIIALFLCLNIEGKATEPKWGFPTSIESYNYGLMSQDGVRIYEKGYTSDGYGSGRAFCTLFRNDYWTTDCSATMWNWDTNENERIAVAVGNMIKKARDITGSGGGIDRDVYFYTEMAINRFLYLYNGYNSVNNVANILSWSSWNRVSNRYTYKEIYYAGVAAYNNYGKSRAKFANLNVTKKDDGNVTATGEFICYDLESNRIRCNAKCTDTISLTATYSDGKVVTKKAGSCKKAPDGMYYIYTGTQQFDSPEKIKKVTANFKTTNTASYRVAHEYYCNSNYNQNLTPNLLGVINPDITVSGSTSRTYKTTDNQQPDEPESTKCVEKLQAIIDSNYDKETLKKKLLELYSQYSTNTQLLNFNEPACAVATNCSAQSNTSCLNSNFSNSSFNENNLSCYNNTVTDDNQNVGYCLTTYNLSPTSYYNVQKVHSGQLYFNVKDGEILEGDFNQTCYFPNGTNLSSKNNGKVSDYIKNLKMANSKESIKLSAKEDNNIELKNEGNNKLSYSTKIKYTIPEIWLELGGKKISKEECENKNCISAGYGIISQLEKSGREEYKFKLDFNNNEKEASCFYESEPEILESPNKINVEFRIIDTNKPFTNRLGKERNTMTNWCVDIDKINKNILTKNFEDKTVNLNNIDTFEQKSQQLNIESSESANSTANDETNDSTENNLSDSKPSSGNDIPAGEVVKGNTNSLNSLQFINRFNITEDTLVSLSTVDVSIINSIEKHINNYKNGKIELDKVKERFKSLQSNIGFGSYYELLDRGDIYKDGIINNIDRDILNNMAQEISPSDLFSKPCSSNNYVVQRMINQRPNSYGIQKDSTGKTTQKTPKYKITLTPQLIDNIKKMAKENNITYNNFNLECEDIEGFNVCRSKLLNKLRTSGDLKTN